MTMPPLEQIMVSLGSHWEQPVFATTNTAYWQDGWRNRSLLRAVRGLRYGAWAHALLVLLAASLLIGRWFANSIKPDYVVSLSHNNDLALTALNDQLAPLNGPLFMVNRARLTIWYRILLLCRCGHLFNAGRLLARHGHHDPQVRAIQVFGIACGLLFQADLQRSQARLIVVANDHSPPTLALLRVGVSLGIPRIYIQHAPVTRYFPPLDVELAVLRDTRTVSAYRAAAERVGQPWRPENCHILGIPASPAARIPLFDHGLSICLVLSMYPDLPQLAAFIRDLRHSEAARTISVRPHPRYPHSLSQLATQLKVTILDADDDLDALLRDTDIFIVSNSGFALDLLRRGAPTVFVDALDHQHRDYFGLVEAGLLPELAVDAFAEPRRLSEIFTPSWQAKVRSVLTGGSGSNDAALIRRIHQLLRGASVLLAEDAKVSVVIPTHNRIRALPQAIRSARMQSHPPYEIIVVDDSSTDGTTRMVREDFPDVILLSLPRRGGACVARNAGIARAGGSHVAFLDSDDAFLPNKLNRQLGVMQQARARFATCGYRLVTGETDLTRQFPDRRLATFNFRGGTSGLIAETSLLRETGFDPAMAAAQDWELFLRLSDQAVGVHIPDALYLYGTTEANRITRSKRRRLLGHVQLYRRHIQSTDRNSLRVQIVHLAIQAMLLADLRGHSLCRRTADMVHRLLR